MARGVSINGSLKLAIVNVRIYLVKELKGETRIYVMSKKKYKKQKSAKADEYYNDGLFELARYGKVVSMRNLSTPEQHAQI